MTIDTYVLFDQVVLKNGNIMTKPEVVAELNHMAVQADQHDRIVGALRAKAVQLREALEWRAENQAGQRELLRSVTAERDAALARVAELEAHCVRLGQGGAERYWENRWRDADARLQELEKQEPVATVAKVPGEDWIGHDQSDQPKGGYSDGYVNGFGECIKVARKVLAAAPGKEVPQAWLDVQAERRRQIEAKGWTPEHDDLYCSAELPRAAAAYILNGANDEAPAIWSFSAKWWKPRDARANYVRAAALILAEIERLDRAASLLSQEVPPCAEH
ncbi:hypothetical protein [Pseudomonas aeruginosa]|uniref:hypothetical protein n=1 Tax=Pseudomonas aeruginosa TaxID=287 RepID=UPI000BB7A6A2|nr:hypothetical protein [Pseudomonas aeruginosa]MBX6838773.1 hypothetical protein [Pseudomonas aeruginosa]MCA6890520.1 hypothetical protein [Pseudomonas aeruginosa]MCT5534650.1 hypothetical protein [Pseudomonas aeruginosa]MCZ7984181.1 hypothetical protein [Pseudomonas aeruginosa]MDP2549576.1 hypothetical protein [Pseudomonas aeruginosa]